MRKNELEHLLTEKLNLKDPTFHLRRVGSKLSGRVISDTFKGMSNVDRLNQVWNVLDDELGTESTHEVGTLLLYTQDEWNVDLPDVPKAKAV